MQLYTYVTRSYFMIKRPLEIDAAWERFLEEQNEKDRNILIAHYFPYVQNISKKLSKKMKGKVQAEDLASHGVDGLIKALENFDVNREAKFETYAYTRIRGAMLDGLRTEDWVPRSVRQRQDRIEGARNRLKDTLGREASDEEVLDELGISGLDYFRNPNKFKASSTSSIDSCVNSDIEGDYNKLDFNKNLVANNDNPDNKMVRNEFFHKIAEKNLDSIEKKIIIYYYYKGLTIKQISIKINISESRISQIHQKALKKLKESLNKDESQLLISKN